MYYNMGYKVVEQIKTQIAVGQLKAGDKLPAVRDLAIEAGVNPNTMQKAFAQLERDGLVYSVRTSGRFVSDNKDKAKALEEELVNSYMNDFTESIKKLGYTPSEVLQLYKEYINKI